MSDQTVVVAETMFERERVTSALEAEGFRVVTGSILASEKAADLAVVKAIIAPPNTVVTARAIDLATSLDVVTSPVIGVDHIDVGALAKRGIPLLHGAAPENYIGMAEAAIGLMVALTHDIRRKDQGLRAGAAWTRGPGFLMSGRTVGLLGGGRIGSAIASRLEAWGCRILVCDPALVGSESGHRWQLVDMPVLFAESDLVSVQIPLSSTTQELVGKQQIRSMQRGSWLVNIGRGGVVDEVAVAEALASGQLAGAAFDVWSSEPPPTDHPLLDDRLNVIATSHNVGHSQEAYRLLADLSVSQTVAVLRGGEGTYRVH